jgi:hypothetical protein
MGWSQSRVLSETPASLCNVARSSVLVDARAVAVLTLARPVSLALKSYAMYLFQAGSEVVLEAEAQVVRSGKDPFPIPTDKYSPSSLLSDPVVASGSLPPFPHRMCPSLPSHRWPPQQSSHLAVHSCTVHRRQRTMFRSPLHSDRTRLHPLFACLISRTT